MIGRLVRACGLAVVVSGVALAATPDAHARGVDLRALGADLRALSVDLSALGADLSALGVQPYEPPKAAPSLALPDLDGKIARLEDYRGKVVLLFFWATW